MYMGIDIAFCHFNAFIMYVLWKHADTIKQYYRWKLELNVFNHLKIKKNFELTFIYYELLEEEIMQFSKNF